MNIKQTFDVEWNSIAANELKGMQFMSKLHEIT